MQNQRSELSRKNKYWIPKFRYLELKNFCLQYPEWKAELNSLDPLKAHSEISPPGIFSDPTNEIVIKRLELNKKISLIDKCAELAEPLISAWLVKGITENYTYEYLKYKLSLPAGREYYYDRYRKFFFILDKKREKPL